jgi:hypothetical protein
MVGEPGDGGIVEHRRGVGHDHQIVDSAALAFEALGRRATEDARVAFADYVEQSDNL